jgi:hypothetical protein
MYVHITDRSGMRHTLDLDELDEVDGDEQMMAFVWCCRHRRYEWHWVPSPSDEG